MKRRKKSMTIFGDKNTDNSFFYKGTNSNIFLENYSRKNSVIGESKFMNLSNVSIIEKNSIDNESFLDFSEKDKREEQSFLNKLDLINSEEKNPNSNSQFYGEDFFFNELNNIKENQAINMTKKSTPFSKNESQINSKMFQKKFDIKETKSYKKSEIKDKGFGIFFE